MTKEDVQHSLERMQDEPDDWFGYAHTIIRRSSAKLQIPGTKEYSVLDAQVT